MVSLIPQSQAKSNIYCIYEYCRLLKKIVIFFTGPRFMAKTFLCVESLKIILCDFLNTKIVLTPQC